MSRETMIVSRSFVGGELEKCVLQVQGAQFIIRRVRTRLGKKTQIFKFVSHREFTPCGKLIEIGWDTSNFEMAELGRELGLEYVQQSMYSRGGGKCFFLEK